MTNNKQNHHLPEGQDYIKGSSDHNSSLETVSSQLDILDISVSDANWHLLLHHEC